MIRIGISGWRYAPWRGVFYPKGLPQKRELEYASRQVGTIEINGSFYALQRPERYLSWHSDTPADFIFAVKAPRYITHIRKLREPEKPLANFFASGVLALQEKLGPLLWQFPPDMRFDPERFVPFVENLPRTVGTALKLARKHDSWMKGLYLEGHSRRRLRHAIEVRHESFADARFLELLEKHDIALTVSHSSRHWPLFEEVTAGFVYVRLHGEGALYSGSYGKKLDDWARKLRRWTSDGRDAYVYFDNDVKAAAPSDAIALTEILAGERARKAA